MATLLPWLDAHLPNKWDMSTDRVLMPPISVSCHALLLEINRRRAQLPLDLLEDPMFAADLPI